MSVLVLTLRAPPRHRVDLSGLTPDKLQGVDAASIARLPLQCGNRPVAVGDLFTVAAGDADDLRLVGDCGKFDRIGAEMTRGAITVEGDAGAYLGHAMRGGRIHVQGSAGVGAAQEMRGGEIAIDGNAGDFLGGARPGEMRGMSGGLVTVRGDAGDRIGDRLRRGTIIVEGSLGAYAASRMIAGTILALGPTIGPYPGFAMKRGSLILLNRPDRELPTFTDCGRHDLAFLHLLLRALKGRSPRLDDLAAHPPLVQRLAGDHSVGGKGELLLWQD
ncbi:MAG: formylmethanofuran dehydrogenase subunit C [Rhodospirillales bacterium]|nr:formylmethanofuran dehydrogenase subunit C [Rhodospirillales bacterium]